MIFNVVQRSTAVPTDVQLEAYLVIDDWDDWFKYNTLYALWVYDEHGTRHAIGGVKIGQFGMEEGQRRAAIPDTFNELDDRFFSLGQDDSYYVNLNKLGEVIRDEILQGLRDVALDNGIFEKALNENVTGVSLLRSVTRSTVLGQFSRLAKGGARLSHYEFSYSAPPWPNSKISPVKLSFAVVPESMPPTNIHVLIGRNGVGKTHLLHHMSRALVEVDEDSSAVGKFVPVDVSLGNDNIFSSIVSVTFSAFDPFKPLPIQQNKSKGVQYSYIGLKRLGKSVDGKPLAPKSPGNLSSEFGKSVVLCSKGSRASRWYKALEKLEADEIFKSAAISGLAREYESDELLKKTAKRLYNNLSSGHKIVLLTITRLVETVEERTLVLLDEPEAHLHPPLLSAFIRALSDLLIDRNGVAIIATHSPVVLQEVPASCVWIIRRNGRIVEADRPEAETFGENVGVLTREVFGLEVTRTGFHRLVHDFSEKDLNFDVVVGRFNSELGGEARALARAIIASKIVRE